MKVTLRRRAKSSWRQWAQPPRTPLVIFFYYLYDYIPNDWRIPLSPGTDVGRYRVYTAIPLEEEEEGFLFFFFHFFHVRTRERARAKEDKSRFERKSRFVRCKRAHADYPQPPHLTFIVNPNHGRDPPTHPYLVFGV
jgi:hypothetical protein